MMGILEMNTDRVNYYTYIVMNVKNRTEKVRLKILFRNS